MGVGVNKSGDFDGISRAGLMRVIYCDLLRATAPALNSSACKDHDLSQEA